jgi:hypothetical protein
MLFFAMLYHFFVLIFMLLKFNFIFQRVNMELLRPSDLVMPPSKGFESNLYQIKKNEISKCKFLGDCLFFCLMSLL